VPPEDTQTNQPENTWVKTRIISSGKQTIGVITLNRPQALNAFNGSMARSLLTCFNTWKTRDDLVCVILHGEGQGGFCSGGDVKDIIAIQRESGTTQAFLNAANQYFQLEYCTDYVIHTYPKPLLIWGHGWVLGGGWGLFSGGSHRVATPSTRLSMPELLIGLFPDVAASWFLNRLPPGVGLFLAMTGARVGAPDAIDLGLADHLLPEDSFPELLASLEKASWTGNPADNSRQLHAILRSLALKQPSQEGPILRHASVFRQLAQETEVEAYAQALEELTPSDPWLQHAQAQFGKGSPSSLAFIFEFMHFAKHLSLKQALMLDWQLAMHFCKREEFHEGVRAMLIDKDKNPQWSPARIADVERQWIRDALHTGHASYPNPLAALPEPLLH